MTLDKVLMPVLDGHPDVFDLEWPLRVADIDRNCRLRLDTATRQIQDIGQDQLREFGFEDTHPLWIVRRTMIDLMNDAERDRLVDNIAGHLLNGVTEPVLQRAFDYWRNVDKDLGDRVEEGVRR